MHLGLISSQSVFLVAVPLPSGRGVPYSACYIHSDQNEAIPEGNLTLIGQTFFFRAYDFAFLLLLILSSSSSSLLVYNPRITNFIFVVYTKIMDKNPISCGSFLLENAQTTLNFVSGGCDDEFVCF